MIFVQSDKPIIIALFYMLSAFLQKAEQWLSCCTSLTLFYNEETVTEKDSVTQS